MILWNSGGAIDDERRVWKRSTIYLDIEAHKILDRCEDDCPFFDNIKKTAPFIEAIWHDTREYSWTYETEIPHASFDIIDYERKYCRGIVFSWVDVDRYSTRCRLKDELLGEALHGVLVASGVLASNSTLTGPELLLAAKDYMKWSLKTKDNRMV